MKIAEMIDKYLLATSEKMDMDDFEFLASCGETRSVERKSVRLLEDKDLGKDLSKAVSAFANYDGGIILLGVDDEGNIEDGVDDVYKRTTVRDRLVALVDGNTTPRLIGYSIKRVEVETGKLFAIVVGESEAAPHQGKDKRYYGRIDGQSIPIDGLMVRDIFTRHRDAILKPYITEPVLDHNKNWSVQLGAVNESRRCADDLLILGVLKFGGSLTSSFKGNNGFIEPTGEHSAKVQLTFKILHPDSPIVVTPITFSNLTHLVWEVDIVARNFSKTAFISELTWNGSRFVRK